MPGPRLVAWRELPEPCRVGAVAPDSLPVAPGSYRENEQHGIGPPRHDHAIGPGHDLETKAREVGERHAALDRRYPGGPEARRENGEDIECPKSGGVDRDHWLFDAAEARAHRRDHPSAELEVGDQDGCADPLRCPSADDREERGDDIKAVEYQYPDHDCPQSALSRARSTGNRIRIFRTCRRLALPRGQRDLVAPLRLGNFSGRAASRRGSGARWWLCPLLR